MKKKQFFLLFLVFLLMFNSISCINIKKSILSYNNQMQKDSDYMKNYEELSAELVRMELNNEADLNNYKAVIQNQMLPNLKESLAYLKSIKTKSKELNQIHLALVISREKLINVYTSYLTDLTIDNFLSKQDELKSNLIQIEHLENAYNIELQNFHSHNGFNIERLD
ncbi:MAG: hypothetical protein PHV06_10025 [bacterium]|nr:hypothetical protein [bacterium]